MLIEFTVTNYRSFRNEQTWSMVADPDLTSPEVPLKDIPKSDDCVLPCAVVYGPNASGKTNLLRALSAMRDTVLNSARSGQRGDEIKSADPFRLDVDHRDAPTEFEAILVQDGVTYRYGFAATKERIMEEWLFASPKGEEQTWFERDETDRSMKAAQDEGSAISFGRSFRGQKKVIQEATRPNALFLSTAVQLNNEMVSPLYDWFRHRFSHFSSRELPPLETISALEEGTSKDQILELLQEADLGIENVEIVQPANAPSKHSIFEKTREVIEGEGHEVVFREGSHVQVFHPSTEGENVGFNLDQESQGTQIYFAMAAPILEALKTGQVIVVDELDASLHPMMVRAIVDFFHDPERNPNGAQLLFNTHDTTLLDGDLFRRDQMWFTEKFSDGASQLYSLLEFEEPEDAKAQNLAQRYLNGRYGAVPILRFS